MADKKITDLQLISSLDGTESAPVDDSIQTYRATVNQIKDYVLNAGLPSVVSKTTTYLATVADEIILADVSGGAWTLTLPTAVGNTGQEFTIKKTDSDFTEALTIDGDGSETIDGSTSTTLNTQGETLKIVSDGTNWEILERRIPGEFVAYTPTCTWVTNTTCAGYWKRVGDSIIVNVKVSTSGQPNDATLEVNVPGGMLIDTTKQAESSTSGRTGLLGFSHINEDGGQQYDAYFTLTDTNTLRCRYSDTGGAVTRTAPLTWGADDDLTGTFTVPIQGWNG